MTNSSQTKTPAETAGAPRIAVVVATYKRAAIVERMVRSLSGESEVGSIYVVDNGQEPGLKALLEQADRRVRYVDAGGNLGCGGGLARGFEEALKENGVTHLWIVDDDAVIEKGCAGLLLEAMKRTGAQAAVPMILGPDGRINSFPGPLREPAWTEIRKQPKPEQFVSVCGLEPLDFTWAPGVCIMVTRSAVEETGGPRSDYWLMGEDVEFTCRLSARYRSILAPEARALHLQPQPKTTDREFLRRYDFVKFCAFLTNTTYTTVHCRHGRRLLRHLPGNYLRFMRNYGWTPRVAWRAAQCFIMGAVRRLPAGSAAFQKFKAGCMEAKAKS